MKLLYYNKLDISKIPNFKKMKNYLEKDDFRSADVKKIGDNLYRSRLDKSNRLLFSIYTYQGENYILLLEFIANHAYDKSRFLSRGVSIDEAKLPSLETPTETTEEIVYLNTKSSRINLLNKLISFDDAQESIYKLAAPLIIIGSAGSGKTALTLEKMKDAQGDILYLTRSPFLVEHSRDTYYALNYENEDQQIDFLSFNEYLASLKVPEGRELSDREFVAWFAKHRQTVSLKDPHQLLEEFKGVITGASTESAYLSREAYLDLGVKQSIYSVDERNVVYDLFLKYLDFMKSNGFYDANILSFEYRDLVEARYDFIVVDEVQDLTNSQLQVVLKSLKQADQFLLCGDANQIVHPNFFSWSKLKSYFYKQEDLKLPAEILCILSSNYRNSIEVTEMANRLLKLKTARFGSLDRESNYLVKSGSDKSGRVLLLEDKAEANQDLNSKTRLSTNYAVVVMHPNQKAKAKTFFQTPLIFSIHEAKGLEYKNIILYNFTSDEESRYREISSGVNPEDLLADELSYNRAKDKKDKSLEIYKFYINALYVAITRTIENLFIIEANVNQSIFKLMGLEAWQGPLDLTEEGSSLASWRQEARKLELQGKDEQAEDIRNTILKIKKIPWQIIKAETLKQLEIDALEQNNKKAKLLLFEYALVYQDQSRLFALAEVGFKPALQPEKGLKLLTQKYFFPYDTQNPAAMLREVDLYGLDFRNAFNMTPVMSAARLANEAHLNTLVEMGADTSLINNAGFNAFQIVLEQASLSSDYAAKKLAGVYRQLEPQSMSLQIEGRLVKLDQRLMEFLMLNLMIAMFYSQLGENASVSNAFSSADFVEVLQHFPPEVLPERRKNRAYISSILSKNEVDRDDKYNRKLFKRIKHGNYIINPKLSILAEGSWRPIYDLLDLDALGFRGFHSSEFLSARMNEYSSKRLEAFKNQLKELVKSS